MQKLAEAITKECTTLDRGFDPLSPAHPELQKAAETWANDAMRVYCGPKLERALNISRAIVDFLAELERDV